MLSAKVIWDTIDFLKDIFAGQIKKVIVENDQP